MTDRQDEIGEKDDTVAPAVALAAEAKAARERALAKASAEKPAGKLSVDSRLATGFAVGIGSAALVAALLYANRGKKGAGK